MAFYIGQECGDLREVIIGRCADFATISQSQLAIDPVSKLHIKRHDMPSHEAINREMDQVIEVLENYGVLVKRPLEIEGVCPLFVRDVACVIDDVFFRTNTISERAGEFAAIESIADREPFQIRQFSPAVRLEGGDVLQYGEYIFVGYHNDNFDAYQTARTNRVALLAIAESFPDRKVIGLELCKSNQSPRRNTLHLDCAFMPLPGGWAIIYEDAFVNKADIQLLEDVFAGRLIQIDVADMLHFATNVLTIKNDVVVCSKSSNITTLIQRQVGCDVVGVDLTHTEKLGGSIHCVSLPLRQAKA